MNGEFLHCTVLKYFTPHTHTHTQPPAPVWSGPGGGPVDSWCNPSHQQCNFIELNCNLYYFKSKIDFSKVSLLLCTCQTSQIAFCCNITVQTSNTGDCLTTKKITLEVRAAWFSLNPSPKHLIKPGPGSGVGFHPLACKGSQRCCYSSYSSRDRQKHCTIALRISCCHSMLTN